MVPDLDPLCGQTIVWLRNGVPIPGGSGPSLLLSDPVDSGVYSVVVSNCAGVVTHSFGTLVRLEVFEELGELKLRSVPAITNEFLVMAATNLTDPSTFWFPFFNNTPSHPLPIILPWRTTNALFFRANSP